MMKFLATTNTPNKCQSPITLLLHFVNTWKLVRYKSIILSLPLAGNQTQTSRWEASPLAWSQRVTNTSRLWEMLTSDILGPVHMSGYVLMIIPKF